MDENSQMILMGMIPLGIVLLGFLGYMHDQIQKENQKQSTDNNPIMKLMLVFYVHPFVFMKRAIGKKSTKDILISVVFIGLIVLIATVQRIVITK